MASIIEYNEWAKTCENYMYNMCKIRTKELRNCVMPRCCSVCNKLDTCIGVCIPMKKIFKELENL